MFRGRRRVGPLVTPIVITVAWLAPSCSAAGGGLWQLGEKVDKNPITVFAMFVLTVIFTLIVEVSKHAIEHRTADPYRRAALGAIYAELMMVGLVSFCLILGAEVGLTDVEIQKPGCSSDSSASASGSGSSAGNTTGSSAGNYTGSSKGNTTGATNVSGCPLVLTACPVAVECPVCGSGSSGSGDPCIVGFDLLLFEYAHLVLMWMGLSYCVFIQVAFWQRDRYVREIHEFEKAHTLYDHYRKTKTGYKGFSVLGIMGLGQKEKWARSVLVLRSSLVLQHSQKIMDFCDPPAEFIRQKLATYEGVPPPAPLPLPEEALSHFDMSRFAKIAMSEVLLELIHVPPAVWLSIIGMSTTNLIHDGLNVDLAYMTLASAGFGPLLGVLLLERMSQHMKLVAKSAVGHPDILRHEFYKASGDRAGEGFLLPVPTEVARPGRVWHEKGEPNPWSDLDGCCDDDHWLNACDPLDPGALVIQMQVVIFATCFYLGTIMMLSQLVLDHVGAAVLVVCWLLPMVPLGWLIPRAILIFSLVHRGMHPSEKWMKYAVKPFDDPDPDAHGHGGHDDGGGCFSCCSSGSKEEEHGHGHDDNKGHGHGHDDHDDHGPSQAVKAGALSEIVRYLTSLPDGPTKLDVTAPYGTTPGLVKEIASYTPMVSPSDASIREPVALDPALDRTQSSVPRRVYSHRPRQVSDETHPLHSAPHRSATESVVQHSPPSRRRRPGEVTCPSCGSHRMVSDTPGALVCQDCGQRVGVPQSNQSARHRRTSPRNGTHSSEMALLSAMGRSVGEIRSPVSSRTRSNRTTSPRTVGAWAGRSNSGTCTHCGSIHLIAQPDGSTVCGKCGRMQQWM